jgi:hypothetical protein
MSTTLSPPSGGSAGEAGRGVAKQSLRTPPTPSGSPSPRGGGESSALHAWPVILAAALLVALGSVGAAQAQQPLTPVAAGNARLEAVAGTVRRGLYPRAFRGEQSYWTLVGVDGGAQSGLMSEDGAVELAKGGVCVEPFVIEDGRLVTWADVAESQSLQDGYLPIPSVTWRRGGWRLKVTSFAVGPAKAPSLVARYDLRNLTRRPLKVTLALVVRPMQVNGPRQFLNTPGGFSPIDDVAWGGGRLVVNGRTRLYPLTSPDRFAAAGFETARTPEALLSGVGGGAAHDANGMAWGALMYTLVLPAHGAATVAWVTPLTDAAPTASPSGAPGAWLDRSQAGVAGAWRERLSRVTFTVPPAARPVVDSVRTSLAFMLMSRAGPTLRPGTRSYDRSWIRDGAMISEGLLRLGEGDVAADYLRWYAAHQFPSGQVPCCVDARGADPTLENDSEGELIHLAAEVYRYGGDKALLRALWPRVQAAAGYMDGLRRSTSAGVASGTEPPLARGLLTPSISHEGYSSKPAYSYWDDFWGLRGYQDAVFIAGALNEREAAARLSRARDDFRRDLYASLTASVRAHGIDYIPGAADLGDFDPTSTTIALSPGGQGETLPKALLTATFERYWRDFVRRRDGGQTWEDYTPYELRNIGAFTRLGWRERAGELLEFFLKDRRPLAWNGWAEVVGRDARKPRFIGDMPHAWVASDYVRSVLDMFAYERDSDHALVLGAGLPPDWFSGPAGVGAAGLRTPYGVLTWSARMRGAELILRVRGAHPPGGYVFAWPFRAAPGAVYGRAAKWDHGALRLSGPGQVAIERR